MMSQTMNFNIKFWATTSFCSHAFLTKKNIFALIDMFESIQRSANNVLGKKHVKMRKGSIQMPGSQLKELTF